MDETLRVELEVETSGAQQGINKTAQAMGSLNGTTNTTNQAVNQLYNAFNRMSGGTIGKIRDFTIIFANVSSAVKKSKEQISALSNSTKELSSALKVLKASGINKSLKFNDLDSASTSIRKIQETIKLIKSLNGTLGFKLQKGFNQFYTSLFDKHDYQQATKYLNNLSSMLNKLGVKADQTDGIFTRLWKNIKSGGEAATFAIAAAMEVAFLTIETTISLAISKIGDELDKTSQKVGMTSTAYQKWVYILERAGVEASSLYTAMRQLANAQADANASFYTLGIDPTKYSQEELFTITITKLQQMENITKRNQIANDLFGRSWSELNTLLNMTTDETQKLWKQYDLLGGTMSSKVVQASAKLEDAITDLKTAWQGLGYTLGEVLQPILTDIINSITVIIAKFNMWLKALFGEDREEYTDPFEAASENADATLTTAKKIMTLISGFDELNLFTSTSSSTYESGSDTDLNINLPDAMVEELQNYQDYIDSIADNIRKNTPILMTGLGLIGAIACFATGHFVAAGVFAGIAGIGITIGAQSGAWSDIFGDIGKSINDTWYNIKEWWKAKVAPIFTQEWWDKNVWKPIGDWFNGLGKKFKDKLILVWTFIQVWWNNNIAPIFTAEYWQKKFDNILNNLGITKIIQKLNIAWLAVKAWWASFVQPTLDKLNPFNADSWGENAKKGIQSAVKSVVEGINSLIDQINEKLTITAFGQVIYKPQLQKLSVPKLAQGAVITNPTMAVMGEYSGAATNPEIVAPQSILKETIDASNGELASAFIQVGRQLIDAINNKDVSVSLGDIDVAKSCSRGNLSYQRMTGISLI